MAPRLELQAKLETLLGKRDVYFQPPPSIQLSYPCIIYQRDDRRTEFADNNPYNHAIRYLVTVIDRNPDSDIPDKVAALPKCSFVRFFVADNLNHDVFSLFF
jgi:hypothetical protein